MAFGLWVNINFFNATHLHGCPSTMKDELTLRVKVCVCFRVGNCGSSILVKKLPINSGLIRWDFHSVPDRIILPHLSFYGRLCSFKKLNIIRTSSYSICAWNYLISMWFTKRIRHNCHPYITFSQMCLNPGRYRESSLEEFRRLNISRKSSPANIWGDTLLYNSESLIDIWAISPQIPSKWRPITFSAVCLWEE